MTETYASIATSVAETEVAATGSGRAGAWLWRKYLELDLPPLANVDAVWPLGDNAPLAATALSHKTATFISDGEIPGHRECTALDGRLIIGDLLACLRLHEAGAREAVSGEARVQDPLPAIAVGGFPWRDGNPRGGDARSQ
ncbi:hypothetical protein [Brachybacterium alimentarium]|uniref:hypothetical protein n=1 Tax=Brachybacterium alimentarium TaxID=47845 RepID=UPI003FD2552C